MALRESKYDLADKQIKKEEVKVVKLAGAEKLSRKIKPDIPLVNPQYNGNVITQAVAGIAGVDLTPNTSFTPEVQNLNEPTPAPIAIEPQIPVSQEIPFGPQVEPQTLQPEPIVTEPQFDVAPTSVVPEATPVQDTLVDNTPVVDDQQQPIYGPEVATPVQNQPIFEQPVVNPEFVTPMEATPDVKVEPRPLEQSDNNDLRVKVEEWAREFTAEFELLKNKYMQRVLEIVNQTVQLNTASTVEGLNQIEEAIQQGSNHLFDSQTYSVPEETPNLGR